MNKDKFIGYMMYGAGIVNCIIASQTDNWLIMLYGIAGMILGSIFLSLKEK